MIELCKVFFLINVNIYTKHDTFNIFPLYIDIFLFQHNCYENICSIYFSDTFFSSKAHKIIIMVIYFRLKAQAQKSNET